LEERNGRFLRVYLYSRHGQLNVWTRWTLGQKTNTILMRRRIHVYLDQLDPGPEDQHSKRHSNQHVVQLGFPSIHCSIVGFPESIFSEPRLLYQKPSTIFLSA
jgi:hypothetical protein